MKIHHKLAHGESIAKESSKCDECGSAFDYYPSDKFGIYCTDCASPEKYGSGGYSKGRDGPKYQRRKVKQIKSNIECGRCGYSEDGRALQFHHTKGKTAGIPELLNKATKWETLLNELRKCEIICANCHSIEHTKEW